jgi:peptidoglycan/LPS O-acetylase OafA/YrhL
LAIVTATLLSDIGEDGLVGRVLGFLGRVSYSTYLLHPIVLGALVRIQAKLGLEVPAVVGAVVVIGATFVASAMVFRFLEEPAIRAGKRVADLATGRVR